jgi:hypothetical protein
MLFATTFPTSGFGAGAVGDSAAAGEIGGNNCDTRGVSGCDSHEKVTQTLAVLSVTWLVS